MEKQMSFTEKGTNYFFGMREHIGVDPVFGYVHTVVTTPANTSEVKVAPRLIRQDDTVVYGDAGYCKLDRYVTDGIQREYRINRQRGTFKRHYGDSLAWEQEKRLESRKSSVRCKVEFVFH